MVRVLIGFAIIVLCSLDVAAEKDPNPDPMPPEEDGLAACCRPGCSPVFCANCSWQCNNSTCAAACSYCRGC